MASRSLPRRPAATALPADDSVPLHERVRHRALLTVAVMGASIMQILDTTIANVAIPHMQSALGATSETVTWVLTSYILASAVAMPITGWLADRMSRQTLFRCCGVVLLLSSLAIPLLLHTPLIWPVFVAFGASAGGLFTLSLIMIGERYRDDELVRANALPCFAP